MRSFSIVSAVNDSDKFKLGGAIMAKNSETNKNAYAAQNGMDEAVDAGSNCGKNSSKNSGKNSSKNKASNKNSSNGSNCR